MAFDSSVCTSSSGVFLMYRGGVPLYVITPCFQSWVLWHPTLVYALQVLMYRGWVPLYVITPCFQSWVLWHPTLNLVHTLVMGDSTQVLA